ncbi:MAG TPA: hypothetical protein VFQ60_05430, partial [Patescibacteria group bacterium]|nr:hypothetical protein [Patescibacteria group bacterium]
SPEGIHQVEADLGNEIILQSDDELTRIAKEWQGEREGRLQAVPPPQDVTIEQIMLMALAHDYADPDEFVKEHPWFMFIGLSEIAKCSTLLLSTEAGCVMAISISDEESDQVFFEKAIKDLAEPPYERLYFVMPDTEENRSRIKIVWKTILDRIETEIKTERARAAQYV